MDLRFVVLLLIQLSALHPEFAIEALGGEPSCHSCVECNEPMWKSMIERRAVYNTIILLLICSSVLVLFRGFLSLGMEMDEVSRVTNLIPLFHSDAQPNQQSIYSIQVGDVEFPIMYKLYISSAYLGRYLPLYLFDDYFLGIRLLHLIYFLLSCIVLYLAVEAKSFYIASMTSLLIATSPVLYPDVRLGFSDGFFLFFFALSYLCLDRFHRTHRSVYLFGGSLLLAFAANQMLYTVWSILGVLGAGVILYPDTLLRYARSWKNWLAVAGGGSIGLFHHVLYNLHNGFPIATVFLSQFTDEPVTIDYSEPRPLGESILVKFQIISAMFGHYWDFYAALFGSVIAATFLLMIVVRKRIYVFPLVTTLLILGLILITPRTERFGHYVYLSPFLELSLVSVCLMAATKLPNVKYLRKAVLAIPVLIVIVNFLVSNAQVIQANKTGGTRLFSPATLAFSHYVAPERIDSRNIVFFVWGLQSQPYFIHKGNFYTKNWVYRMIDLKEESAHFQVYKEFFRSIASIPKGGDSLYFPFWAAFRSDITESFQRFVDNHGGKLAVEHIFPERSGEPAILFYRLDNVSEFAEQFREGISAAPQSEKLEITGYGPERVDTWPELGPAMWFTAREITPTTTVYMEGLGLETVRYSDRVTARVPADAIERGHRYELFLYDPKRHARSQSVFLTVAE